MTGSEASRAGSDQSPCERYLAYNGMVLDAVYPGSTMSMRFRDLGHRSPRSVIRPRRMTAGEAFVWSAPQR